MLKTKDMYAVILAGGSGERFWPLSTSSRPKQFLAIPSGQPLICAAVGRMQGLIPPKQVFIITRRDLVALTRRVLPKFPAENIIGEPCGRDTAAAVALGAGLIKRRNSAAAFCVLTADQLIGAKNKFRETLRAAFRLALSSNRLVTIGIKPDYPSTGFGYIEAGQALAGAKGIFNVKRFVEKPDRPTAALYIKSGRYYWNSGMFIWSVSSIEKALAAHRPQLVGLIRKISETVGLDSGMGVLKLRRGRRPSPYRLKLSQGRAAESAPRRQVCFDKILEKEYAKLEKISIDYAVLEKAGNIVMIKSNFTWDDVGSWTALEKHCRKDHHGNIVLGRAEALDAGGNIAVAEDGVIALVGVRDLVVVRSGAATLVCAKDRVQDVKKIVALLKNSGKNKGLV